MQGWLDVNKLSKNFLGEFNYVSSKPCTVVLGKLMLIGKVVQSK